jgi:hypothetical protein
MNVQDGYKHKALGDKTLLKPLLTITPSRGYSRGRPRRPSGLRVRTSNMKLTNATCRSLVAQHNLLSASQAALDNPFACSLDQGSTTNSTCVDIYNANISNCLAYCLCRCADIGAVPTATDEYMQNGKGKLHTYDQQPPKQPRYHV